MSAPEPWYAAPLAHLVAASIEPAEATHSHPRPLREWLADPTLLLPPQTLIPKLVLEGRITLLAAREKAGKSTLLAQAVASFSSGREFLGEACGPGKVLWYAIDEAVSDAVRRLHSNGSDLDSVFVHDECPTADGLRDHIAEYAPRLVVVDTLTELLTGRLSNDRDAMEMNGVLNPFTRVLRGTNTAAVFVHHSTKDGRDYRGSGQLGAKVDIIALLKIPSAGIDHEEDPDVDAQLETRRTLAVRGRGLNGSDRLNFNGTCYVLGEGSQALPERVLRAVREGHSSTNKIVAAVGARKQSVSDAINAMVAAGTLGRETDSARLFIP